MQSKQPWGNPTTFFTPCSRANRGRCLFLPGRPFLSYGADRRFGMLQIPVKGHEKGRIPKDAPCANHANGKNLFLAAEIRRENQELVTDILAPSLGNEGVLKVVVVIQFQSLGALGGRENQNLAGSKRTALPATTVLPSSPGSTEVTIRGYSPTELPMPTFLLLSPLRMT